MASRPTPHARLAPVILSLAWTAPALHAQDFVASLAVDDGQGIAYELVFGFSPDATDVYDPAFDTYAPPPPPTPSFDAALGWGAPIDRYYSQVLLGDGDISLHVFEVQLQYDTNQLVHLSWDSSAWSDLMSSCFLRDPFGAGLINIDMLTESELSITNTAFTVLHLEVTPAPWTPGIESFCAGDSCPCGNNTTSGAGCANGTGAGALLWGSGSVSVSSSNLTLHAQGLIPNQPGLYFQGNNAVNSGRGAFFGDGLRCAGGGVIRLEVRFADSLGSSSTSVDVAARGGCAAGDVKRYQLWYRDPTTTPCGAQFNLSNGAEVTWAP